MAQPKQGDTVAIHYTGRLEDGTVFDSSEGREPLEFTVGAGQVIPGFEAAVLGLEPGQTATTTIKPKDAYGPRDPDMIVQMPRSEMPPGVEPAVGQQYQLGLADGNRMPVVVTAVTDVAVTFDANHPLAGKTLIFDIELVGVK